MKIKNHIHGVSFYSIDSAHKLNLMRLTKWLQATKEEVAYFNREVNRINDDSSRTALLVYHKEKIALFVNPVAVEEK